MKQYIIGGLIACLLTLAGLFIANYFTCFGYELPHKPAIIEVAPDDINMRTHPQFIIVPNGFNQTTITIEEWK